MKQQDSEPTKLEWLVELSKAVIHFKATVGRVTAQLEDMLQEDEWQPPLPYPEKT